MVILIRKLIACVVNNFKMLCNKAISCFFSRQYCNALKLLLFETVLSISSFFGSYRLRLLGKKTGLKLHLGCGTHLKLGWINIDAFNGLLLPVYLGTSPVYVRYDLRRGLSPLGDSSCSYIYSAHFFEHLDYTEIKCLLDDCSRVLEPGGTFRIVLPDIVECFKKYLSNDKDFFNLLKSNTIDPSLSDDELSNNDYLTYSAICQGQHKYIFDIEKLEILFRKFGFTKFSVSEFNEDLDMNTETRKRYSFYMEAIK